MTFKIDGFLSPEIEEYRRSLRDVPEFKVWLDFAGELNRLGYEMLNGHETPKEDEKLRLISILFIRAHQSFQASLILIERGLLGDARVVLRSAFEGTIALIALEQDDGFVEKLEQADAFLRRKSANVALNELKKYLNWTKEERRQLEKTIADVKAQEQAAGKEFGDIIWANVAKDKCPTLYGIFYRLLSNDGAHTNRFATHRFSLYDADGKFSRSRHDPDMFDVVSIITMACIMFLSASGPFVGTHAPSFASRFPELGKKFDELPLGEPEDLAALKTPE